MWADALKVFFLTISALFPIVDPLTGSPLFLSLTEQYPPETRRAIASRVAVDSLLLMIGSYFIGSHVLSFFGVSLPVVQVAGGLVVVSVGWQMLMHSDEQQPDRQRAPSGHDIQDIYGRAFYPLTLPLTVGPGSISVAITLGANATHRYGLHLSIIIAALLAMFFIAISILLCYGFADRLGHVIGKTGMVIVVRLAAFLLLCVGVQIFWNGASALLTTLRFRS